MHVHSRPQAHRSGHGQRLAGHATEASWRHGRVLLRWQLQHRNISGSEAAFPAGAAGIPVERAVQQNALQLHCLRMSYQAQRHAHAAQLCTAYMLTLAIYTVMQLSGWRMLECRISLALVLTSKSTCSPCSVPSLSVTA